MRAKLCALPGTCINWSDMYYFAIISRTYMYLGGSFCSWLAICAIYVCVQIVRATYRGFKSKGDRVLGYSIIVVAKRY
jgi:hypothetical protein